MSFENIAREWIDKQLKGITTKRHVRAVTNRLRDYRQTKLIKVQYILEDAVKNKENVYNYKKS